MINSKILKVTLTWSLLACATYAYADGDDMVWFKNEMICADAKITVNSYCRDEAGVSVNTLCTMQNLILEKNIGKKIKINLLKHEPSRGYFHSVRSLSCVEGKNKKNYLYISLGNGGNCDECEVSAVMDLNGVWKRYYKRWYARPAEKNEIKKREDDWFHHDSFLLENKIKK